MTGHARTSPSLQCLPRLALLGLLLVLARPTGCGAPAAKVPPEELITTEGLMETVRYLASPELDGRLAGSEGYEKAARHAAGRFAELGLRPGGEDGYLQHLPLEYNELTSAPRLALVSEDGTRRDLLLGQDFVARGFSGSGRLVAPVVFVGYGLSLPDRGYDDYEGRDLTGRVALAFKQPPEWELDDGEGWGSSHLPRPKARAAAEHGAIALLLVSTAGDGFVRRPHGSVLHGAGEQDRQLPQLHVDRPVAEEILARSGLDLTELQTRIDETRRPFSAELETRVHIEVEARYEPDRPVPNVVGILEGADDTLRQEFVVIGGHLDHVGRQSEEVYFPGAQDNASGAAAVMHIAEAFVRGGVAPRRSVVFVLFAAEEQGLNGARHFVEHSPLPLERCVAMLNLDCVARGDGLQLGGGKASPGLWELARAIDAAHAGRTVEETWYGGGADAQPFFEAGVPTLYFANTNAYGDIHSTTDGPGTLDPDLFTDTARLAFLTAAEIAAGGYEREERQPRDS